MLLRKKKKHFQINGCDIFVLFRCFFLSIVVSFVILNEADETNEDKMTIESIEFAQKKNWFLLN